MSASALVPGTTRRMEEITIYGFARVATPCQHSSATTSPLLTSLITPRILCRACWSSELTPAPPSLCIRATHHISISPASDASIRPRRCAPKTMVFTESRGRVIALIDSLMQHDPTAFADNRIGDNTAIRDAFIVIDGEPMAPVSDEAIA